jgi:hypothetical protein
MELQLANKVQHHIADLLWKAKSTDEVKEIIGTYGKDAVVVFIMMMAAYYDQVDATDLAEIVINQIK